MPSSLRRGGRARGPFSSLFPLTLWLRRLSRRVFFCVLTLTMLIPCAEARQNKPTIYAGYRTLSSSLPAQRLMIHMGVWYPTRRKSGTTKVGDWSFRAARNAPVMEGPWPVIILSHDVTGTAWTHHDIAAELATRGFIVAAPTHDHDNGEDMALLFSDRELPVRALQLRAALDVVLEHPQIGKQADVSRIAFLGFGMPSAAGLLLAGGEMTPDAWPEFCGERPSEPDLSDETPEKDATSAPSLSDAVSPDVRPDNAVPPISVPQVVPPRPLSLNERNDRAKTVQNFLVTPAMADDGLSSDVRALLRPSDSPWCSPFLAGRMDELVASMKHRTLEREEKTVMMRVAVSSREQLFRRLSDSVARSHQRQLRLAKSRGIPTPPVALPLLPPLSHNTPVADGRFRAMAFVSPGFSMLFNEKSLAAVRIPCLFVGAERERWNKPEEQAKRFAAMLHRSEYMPLHQADAAALQAECPESDPAGPLASLCASVDQETRTAIHSQLVSSLQEFFNRIMGRENQL
ncbi:alpha/beta hydrolase family protein [Mailhella sp.]|uniref:alpha/beta hydrolase family protein n=1 Tax=Mailhella sp. TaxID=1981029 RepID=UPI003AB8861B